MRIVCFFSLLMMHFSLNAQTSSFNITYTGTSNQVEQAINKAADIWSNILISNVPIKLNITWGDASSLGVLGITISNGIKDFPNAPYSNVWYPSCLADAFAGYDLQPSDTDMDIFLDSSTDWYFGLDGNCPFWQHDLVSCALHEIGHGLGFYSVANISTQNEGSFSLQIEPFAISLASFPMPNLNGEPLIYDLFVQNVQGDDLIDTNLFQNPSNLLASEFTSDYLYFSGINSMNANNNSRPKIYAPGAFAFGSSVLHLDETVFHSSTSDALMTPFSSSGEVNHLPGAITVGVLLDIGWNINGVSLAENTKEPFVLNQNYPNPFINETTISFSMNSPSKMSLDLYNVRGEKVRSLLNSKQSSGSHKIKFEPKDDQGNKLFPGVYFYILKNKDTSIQKKLMVCD